MTRGEIFLAALEIRRRYSEASALDASDRVDFQRSRSDNTAWLDWAAWFLRPFDELQQDEQVILVAFYAEASGVWGWDEMTRAGETLDRFWSQVPAALIRQGEIIAGRV